MKKTILAVAVPLVLSHAAFAEMDTSSVTTLATSTTTTTLTAPVMPAAKPTAAELNARRYQPWLDQINLPYLNQLGNYNGKNIIVGVADTGLQVDHPMLKSQVVATYNAFDGSKNVADTIGHGTFVSSEIVGSLANGAPLEGVAPGASLAFAKVFNSAGSTTSDKVDIGINWLVNTAHARIINLSLGGTAPAMQSSIQNGVNKGVLFTIAAGNDGATQSSWPARFANQSWANSQIIAVGAAQNINGNWGLASFSNKPGDAANWYVLAPGVNVTAGYMGSQYATGSGTSMAAPIVAGQAALLESLWPQLKADQTAQIIFKTATHLCSDGTKGTACTNRTAADPLYGWGLINVMKSMQPVGGLTVTTASGTSKSVLNLNIGAVQGAASGALRAAALNGGFVMAGVDNFNRQYSYDAGQTLSTAPSHSLDQIFDSSDRIMRYGEIALDRQGSKLAFASYNQNSANLNSTSPLSQLTQKTALSGTALIQKLNGGHEFAAGTGGMNLYFGLAGSDLPGVSALAASTLSNPYFALVPQATSVGYGINLDHGIKVKLGVASSALASAINNQYGISSQNMVHSQIAMAEITKSFKDSTIGLEFAQLDEHNAMLGTQLGNGFDLSDKARTVAITLNAAYKVSDKMVLAGYVSQGYTKGFNNNGDSFVTSVSDTRSQAFGAGLVYADVFQRNDRLTASISSPLKTVSGNLSLNVPTSVDADGNLIREVRLLSLSEGKREMIAQTSYFTPISKMSGISATLMYRQNANGVAGQNEAVAAIRYNLSF